MEPPKSEQGPEGAPSPKPHRRRARYSGKYPRRFEQKYKELAPEKFPETVAKVMASGKTPAGSHRSILVDEVITVLRPEPGKAGVDCTLGYGGHAEALLSRLLPGGKLLGLDQDPVELPRTEERLRGLGYGPDALLTLRTNFAGLGQALTSVGWEAADLVLADLGVSSMQLDNPERGFSYKFDGPLDMRMNPRKGDTAGRFLQRSTVEELAELLRVNADEPAAAGLGAALAGKTFATTTELARAIRQALRGRREGQDAAVRRVFQALRIAVNDEFGVLDTFLRQLPHCLRPGGRAAVITFHSGEDRRVKQAFSSGLRAGVYGEISAEVIRPSAEEIQQNPRSSPAKLRWAERARGDA